MAMCVEYNNERATEGTGTAIYVSAVGTPYKARLFGKNKVNINN